MTTPPITIPRSNPLPAHPMARPASTLPNLTGAVRNIPTPQTPAFHGMVQPAHPATPTPMPNPAPNNPTPQPRREQFNPAAREQFNPAAPGNQAPTMANPRPNPRQEARHPVPDGWQYDANQRACPPNKTRILSTTLWVSFPPSSAANIEAFRAHCAKLGELKSFTPDAKNETAFIKYANRNHAQNALQALLTNLPDFVLRKIGWGKAPNLPREDFDFQHGVGYIHTPRATPQPQWSAPAGNAAPTNNVAPQPPSRKPNFFPPTSNVVSGSTRPNTHLQFPAARGTPTPQTARLWNGNTQGWPAGRAGRGHPN